MHKFIPEPVHSSEWWSENPIVNALGQDQWENEPITGKSWVICGGYISEPYAPVHGYPRTFPTATDCLLWLRWMALPDMSEGDLDNKSQKEIELIPEIKEIADIIDNAADGSNSEEMLELIFDDYWDVIRYSDFYLTRCGSIHDYLSDIGTLKSWRKATNDPTMEMTNGIWMMSEDSWAEVAEYISTEFIECGVRFDEDGESSNE